jgi:GTP-binding protein EngB required for normal cell division
MTARSTSETLLSAASEARAVSLAAEVIESFGLSDLRNLFRALQAQQQKEDLNVAILGRFKAGKSSLLNDIIGKPLLPVGALPVTSVVTEICYGESEYAEVVSLDSSVTRIRVAEIGSYVSESENPHNLKGVDVVHVFLPSLARFQGIRFVDTPGLESIFQHNTEASLSWTPNVDLAVVAVGADPPLTQQDISLIQRLFQYTPNVSVLLTKVDILGEAEREEVEQFVRVKLREKFDVSIPVFPYSIKPGYESLRKVFEEEQIQRALLSAHEQRRAILVRKLSTLLRSAEDYLQLSLRAAETAASQREQLHDQVLGSQEFLAHQKLQLQLLARHAAGKTRGAIDTYLQRNARRQLEEMLKGRLKDELPKWRGGLFQVLSAFENWLRRELAQELTAVSSAHQHAFCEPLREVERQWQRNLQAFRDQLSEKVMRVFGIPLRTTETEIEIQPPRSPDISLSHVFDHSWEIISFLIPMPLVRWAVERRFYERVEQEVYKNLSRLTTQWEEQVHAAIFSTAKEAERRFDELVVTVGRLLSGEDQHSKTNISSYLDRVRDSLKQLS